MLDARLPIEMGHLEWEHLGRQRFFSPSQTLIFSAFSKLISSPGEEALYM